MKGLRMQRYVWSYRAITHRQLDAATRRAVTGQL